MIKVPCLQLAAALVMGFSLTACATFRHDPVVTISSSAPSLPLNAAAEQKQRLLQEIEGSPERESVMRDIVLALEAEMREDSAQWGEASEKWREVFRTDKGAVASEAFRRWAFAQSRASGNGESPDALAQLLLNDIPNSAWLKKEKLTSKEALVRRLMTLRVPGAKALADEKPLPGRPTDIGGDTTWEKAAKAACARPLPQAWEGWIRSLKGGSKFYWDGLQKICVGENTRAAEAFRKAIPLLQSQLSDLPRALRAAELMIQNYKSVGDREATTAAYRMQYDLLKRQDLPLDVLGWTGFEKTKREIESAYWVGRNLALQGEYETARRAVEEGLNTVEQIPSDGLGKKERVAIDELKADGYHIIASRIAYEQKDMNDALALTASAQAIPNLSLEWRQRLAWAQGWYSYTAGDRDAALKAWAGFLNASKDDSSKAKALYWIGRASWESGDRSAAKDAFERLRQQSPLSFYSVIGLPAIDSEFDWRNGFDRPDELADDLQSVSEFSSEAFVKDAEASRRLLRLEIAVAANVQSWTKDLAWELFRYVSTKKALMKDLEAGLFVSRVLHMSGQHLLSISMTTALLETHENVWKDYPEQVLIFFPQPFAESVDRAAAQNQIERELILAISRQESSFRPDAESAVGALGLMQLMPATAKEQAKKLDLKVDDLDFSLRQPDTNIQLGSLYLASLGKRYRAEWPKAFSAYNAGEYATDAWIARRNAIDIIAWSEALSFGETSGYVKNVWRNWVVYKWLTN